MQYKTEKSVQLRRTININLLILQSAKKGIGEDEYQMKNNFTIGMSFKIMRLLQTLSNCSMIVYFAIDGENKCGIVIDNRLSARIWTPCYHIDNHSNGGVCTDTNNCQSFMT